MSKPLEISRRPLTTRLPSPSPQDDGNKIHATIRLDNCSFCPRSVVFSVRSLVLVKNLKREANSLDNRFLGCNNLTHAIVILTAIEIQTVYHLPAWRVKKGFTNFDETQTANDVV